MGVKNGDVKNGDVESGGGREERGKSVGERERACGLPYHPTAATAHELRSDMSDPALSDEEFARRGNALFERRVRPTVDVDEEAHKFVAIDVETGEYEVDESEVEATDRLIEREPEAEGQIWLRRVGYEYAHRLGSFGSTR